MAYQICYYCRTKLSLTRSYSSSLRLRYGISLYKVQQVVSRRLNYSICGIARTTRTNTEMQKFSPNCVGVLPTGLGISPTPNLDGQREIVPSACEFF